MAGINPRNLRLTIPTINNNSYFVGSMPILNAVFDAIDQNIFNCNLDGAQLEWCDTLKSRAIVTYQEITFMKKEVHIRCSKNWFQNCTRKQFMESILYEMLDLYLTINTGNDKKNDSLHMYLLECAIIYLNRRFETNLQINYNYNYLNYCKDSTDVNDILNSIAVQHKNLEKKPLIDGFKMSPYMQVLTNKLVGNSEIYKCKKGCLLCYCQPQLIFRHRFQGANIYAIFTADKIKCLLCEKVVKPGTMDAHLDNNCFVFKPLTPSIYADFSIGDANVRCS